MLRVIHDENFKSFSNALRRTSVILCLIPLSDYGVFADLGLIHQAVCSLHSLFDRLPVGHAPANAHRQFYLGKFHNFRFVNMLSDPPKLYLKGSFRNLRQNKKELISTHTDQHIRLTDITLYDSHNLIQYHIPGMMAIGIIIQFKIIQVDHGHTGPAGHIPYTFLIEPAIVDAGQCIPV